jgi:hypothetical protein
VLWVVCWFKPVSAEILFSHFERTFQKVLTLRARPGTCGSGLVEPTILTHRIRNSTRFMLSNAALGGSLSLSLFGGFTPAFGNTFTIFNASTLGGTFANVGNGQRLSTLGGEGSFVVNYNNGTGEVVLSNFVINGDYNLNGRVDASDYVLWRKTPTSYGGAGGYATWRSNFGRSNLAGAGSGTGSMSSQTAVPEPSAILLGLLAGIGAILQCGRRRETR